jgi:hypothetical protein
MFRKSIIKKPYMFRLLLYDYPQGSSFVLEHLPLFGCLLRHLSFRYVAVCRL